MKDSEDNAEKNQDRLRTGGWIQNILISIVSSIIFTLFVENLVRRAGSSFVSFLGQISASWEDKWYFQSVVVSTNAMLFGAFSTIFSAMMGIINGSALIFILSSIFMMKLRKTGNLHPFHRAVKKTPIIVPLVGLILVTAILNIILYAEISGWYLSIQAAASFDRRMLSLSGIISEDEKNVLLRQWALVHGKADYNAVMNTLDNFSRVHHTQIPKRFI